jgi:hypothetical protein
MYYKFTQLFVLVSSGSRWQHTIEIKNKVFSLAYELVMFATLAAHSFVTTESARAYVKSSADWRPL